MVLPVALSQKTATNATARNQRLHLPQTPPQHLCSSRACPDCHPPDQRITAQQQLFSAVPRSSFRIPVVPQPLAPLSIAMDAFALPAHDQHLSPFLMPAGVDMFDFFPMVGDETNLFDFGTDAFRALDEAADLLPSLASFGTPAAPLACMHVHAHGPCDNTAAEVVKSAVPLLAPSQSSSSDTPAPTAASAPVVPLTPSASSPHACCSSPTASSPSDSTAESPASDDSGLEVPGSPAATKKSTTAKRGARDGRSRPFLCTFSNCGKRYTKSSHLKAHIRTHTGERPFVCQWENCSWSFSRSDELTRHYRKHTGARPYICDQCARSFARSDHLAAHLKTHQQPARRPSPPTKRRGGTRAADDSTDDSE